MIMIIIDKWIYSINIRMIVVDNNNNLMNIILRVYWDYRNIDSVIRIDRMTYYIFLGMVYKKYNNK